MSSDLTDSREFLAGLLREANIIDEIIDDVVEACEIANYSPFTLASNSMTVPTLSEKLSLTQKEAETLKQVTLKRLNAIESTEESTSRSIEASSTTKISVEVLNSCEEEPLGFKESFPSLESFQDSSKEAKAVQGRGELDSMSHWTDCTAEEGSSSSDHSTNEKISTVHLLEEDVDESSGMTILADVYLDEAQRPRGRPFIPMLHLKDAGISVGVPEGCQSDATLSDSISSASIDQLSPLPLSRSPTKGAKKKKKQSSKRNCRMECTGGIKNPKIPLPSYLRPTVASEARKAATLGKKEPSKGSRCKVDVVDQSMVFQSNVNGFKKTKIPYSHIVKPTRAALARMEFIKRRLESTSVEKDKGFRKKRSCALKVAVQRSNNKAISKSHAMIAV